jgi:hypothetical protein
MGANALPSHCTWPVVRRWWQLRLHTRLGAWWSSSGLVETNCPLHSTWYSVVVWSSTAVVSTRPYVRRQLRSNASTIRAPHTLYTDNSRLRSWWRTKMLPVHLQLIYLYFGGIIPTDPASKPLTPIRVHDWVHEWTAWYGRRKCGIVMYDEINEHKCEYRGEHGRCTGACVRDRVWYDEEGGERQTDLYSCNTQSLATVNEFISHAPIINICAQPIVFVHSEWYNVSVVSCFRRNIFVVGILMLSYLTESTNSPPNWFKSTQTNIVKTELWRCFMASSCHPTCMRTCTPCIWQVNPSAVQWVEGGGSASLRAPYISLPTRHWINEVRWLSHACTFGTDAFNDNLCPWINGFPSPPEETHTRPPVHWIRN